MVFHTHSPGWLGEYGRALSKLLLYILFVMPAYLSAETEIPVLTSDTDLATAGYYQLSWQPGVLGAPNKNFYFELQQSSNVNFVTSQTIYQGPDQASVISGQPDGDYYYRVRSINSSKLVSEWSDAVLVKVQHHSLKKAWLFFVAGAIVFLFTLIFITSSAFSKTRD